MKGINSAQEVPLLLQDFKFASFWGLEAPLASLLMLSSGEKGQSFLDIILCLLENLDSLVKLGLLTSCSLTSIVLVSRSKDQADLLIENHLVDSLDNFDFDSHLLADLLVDCVCDTQEDLVEFLTRLNTGH